jgi:hypothetical protein
MRSPTPRPSTAVGLARLLVAFVALMGVFGVLLPSGRAEAAPGMRAPTADELEAPFTPPPAPPAGWVTEGGVFAQVHARPDDGATAARLARHAEAAVPRLAEALGVPPGATIQVFLAPDHAQFLELQPGRAPDWADGTAWPSQGTIFLHAPRARPGTDEPLEQVLDHELVHIILGRAFAPRRVPHWLQEGAAQVLARQLRPELTERLAAGQLGDNLLSLDDLTRSFPADPVRARLAYAQAADFVAWLQNTHGDDALREITQALAQGESVEMALRGATGEDLRALDAAWRERLASTPIWLSPLVTDTALMGAAVGLLLIGGRGVRRRRAEVLARWEREEALQDAIYRNLSGQGQPALPPAPAPPRWSHPEPHGVA